MTGTVSSPIARAALRRRVPVNKIAVAFGQHRDTEAEFADDGHHARHGLVVFAWIVLVGDEPFYRPLFDSERCHISPRYAKSCWML